ncbi:hypothetical protein T9A_01635 [Alcanivorax jadensis T9]|jgi:glycosyltransferase involved in cell wall biosynthesis|uniref:Glycosyltransferase subfamily 4-like N-terminal domain-containing protein n=1 Tax=Alcanivorax jadensis T9 TaxID=1177181 RepID=A0ABR4WCK8_9GAMM|nr:glycosyltransferase [Alcanivorax jadensis]KGD61186.1 hypothetical protein T9A_01635 [Alcanivorax jadensis T9]|tara:strand:+ start:8021 stop:9259 length:1239 start_codon:yes stop_codon:yes gene_type:complete
MSKNVLFVTWDGPQVNYLESLFAPIFERLESYGYQFHVIQFTWADSSQLSRSRKACEDRGIPYRSVRILRWPSISIGSVLSVLCSKNIILRSIKDWNIDILMPRATLPAWAVERANRNLRLPVVFDSDGLPVDEKVEFEGLKVSGLAHRMLRDIEFRALHYSQAIMVRSSDAASILKERAGASFEPTKFFVVGNGRDSTLFAPCNDGGDVNLKKSIGLDAHAPTVAYVGSLGGKYRFDQVLEFFNRLRILQADLQLLVVTPSPDLAIKALSNASQNDAERCVVVSVFGNEVPQYLSFVDLGLMFIEPSYSMRAVAPVKLGEYLLCGLPVVATVKNIGDSADVLSPDFGFPLFDVGEQSLQAASEWFVSLLSSGNLPGARKEARKAGVKYFSMEAVIDGYVRSLDCVLPRGIE